MIATEQKKKRMNAEGVQRNILYFSKQCPHSDRFRQLLMKKPDIESNFMQICVDNGTKLPRYIRSVPFLVVFDEQGHSKHLTDAPAFDWLREQMNNYAGNFEAYDAGAMSSTLSDSFSFLGEAASGAAHTFEWIDGHRADSMRGSIMTPNESTYGGGNNSGKTAIPKSELDKIMEQRNRDIPHNRVPPKEIDFTKPLQQQQQQTESEDQRRSRYTASVRKRETRMTAPRNGVDFSNPRFRANVAAKQPIRRNPPPSARVGRGRGRGHPVRRAPQVGRKLPQGWSRRG